MNARLLRRLPGLAALAFLGLGGHVSAFSISSPAFGSGRPIPAPYARVHDNVSPPLMVSGTPARAKSLALVMDDPDAPAGLWTHWLVWNIAPGTGSIAQHLAPPGAVEGRNSFGDTGYDGPAPPNGKHRYFFHLYALDTRLDLPPGANRDALAGAMRGHILARAQMFGTFATGQ